jgi:hypothetical protein
MPTRVYKELGGSLDNEYNAQSGGKGADPLSAPARDEYPAGPKGDHEFELASEAWRLAKMKRGSKAQADALES